MQHNNSYSYRLEPEVMIGLNKNWMLHGALYTSTMFTNRFHFEGGSLYGKYRFLSIDDVHSHFRMAAFGKISLSNNPVTDMYTVKHDAGNGEVHEQTQQFSSNEIDLAGNNTGMSGGLIATQLIHKLALSATAAYVTRWDNSNLHPVQGMNNNAVNYSLSTGYLLFPKSYSNYRQTNINLYAEVLGSSGLDKKGFYLDIAPGIQFIFNSISRLDIAYRVQVAGDMARFNQRTWLLRYEYNFLNVFVKKQK